MQTDPEIAEILDRQRIRGILATIGASLGVVVMVAFIVVTFFIVVPDSRHVSDLADRGDCKTHYDALLSAQIVDRANLGFDLNAQLGAALLQAQSGKQPTPAAVQHYLDTQKALADAITKVKAQPTLNMAVDHGFTLDGVKYPPCPTVG